MAKKILIVDDEEDISTSVKQIVESMGYEGKTANGGKQALEILKKEIFDLVLLDILMPETSGQEVLEKIRADPKLKNQKVAYLTVVELGQKGKEVMKKLKPVEYLNKPIDPVDLRNKLKKIVK